MSKQWGHLTVLKCSRTVLEPILHNSRTVLFIILEPIMQSSRTIFKNSAIFWNLNLSKNCSYISTRTARIVPEQQIFLLSFRVICQCSWIQTILWSPNPYLHLVICQNIVLEKFVLCLFSPSLYFLTTNDISFILKWVGYACFNNREGVDEPMLIKLFKYITFFNFACYSADNIRV